MKFELEPDNRDCPDEVLLQDLITVAKKLSKDSLSKDEYNKHGRFCAATMQNRFNSWNNALEKSGLNFRKRVDISKQELLSDIKRVAEITKQSRISQTEYESHGKFSCETISRKFGSWKKALNEIGLEPSLLFNEKSNESDLMENLAAIWELLGRQPKQSDLPLVNSKFSAYTYTRRYGSWRKSLERCIEVATQEEVEIKESEIAKELISKEILNNETQRRKTNRNPSWRLVFLVYRKNNFSCVACGRSPVTHPGTILHVDHINPWSKGGETIIDNLQTLCSHCNLGKSDLSMTET